MLKIEIKEANLTGRKWKSGDLVYEQHAWAFIPERNGNTAQYPQKVTLRLADQAQPYPVGTYRLMPQSFYVGDYNVLIVGQAILEPLVASQKLAA
jgi:hypothetical protein